MSFPSPPTETIPVYGYPLIVNNIDIGTLNEPNTTKWNEKTFVQISSSIQKNKNGKLKHFRREIANVKTVNNPRTSLSFNQSSIIHTVKQSNCAEINDVIGNNYFYYRWLNGENYKVVFPNGLYNIKTLNDMFYSIMFQNKTYFYENSYPSNKIFMFHFGNDKNNNIQLKISYSIISNVDNPNDNINVDIQNLCVFLPVPFIKTIGFSQNPLENVDETYIYNNVSQNDKIGITRKISFKYNDYSANKQYTTFTGDASHYFNGCCVNNHDNCCVQCDGIKTFVKYSNVKHDGNNNNIQTDTLKRLRSNGPVKEKTFTNNSQYLEKKQKNSIMREEQIQNPCNYKSFNPENNNMYLKNNILKCIEPVLNKVYLFSNDKITFSWSNTSVDVIFDEGWYDFYQIKQIIENKMLENGHYYYDDKDNRYFLINFNYDISTFKTLIFVNLTPTGTIKANNNWDTRYLNVIISNNIANIMGVETNYFVNYYDGNYNNTINKYLSYTNFNNNDNTPKYILPYVWSSVKYNSFIPIYTQHYYKPNNVKFMQQGAVSSSAVIARKKYNEITNTAIKNTTSKSSTISNELAYATSSIGYLPKPIKAPTITIETTFDTILTETKTFISSVLSSTTYSGSFSISSTMPPLNYMPFIDNNELIKNELKTNTFVSAKTPTLTDIEQYFYNVRLFSIFVAFMQQNAEFILNGYYSLTTAVDYLNQTIKKYNLLIKNKTNPSEIINELFFSVTHDNKMRVTYVPYTNKTNKIYYDNYEYYINNNYSYETGFGGFGFYENASDFKLNIYDGNNPNHFENVYDGSSSDLTGFIVSYNPGFSFDYKEKYDNPNYYNFGTKDYVFSYNWHNLNTKIYIPTGNYTNSSLIQYINDAIKHEGNYYVINGIKYYYYNDRTQVPFVLSITNDNILTITYNTLDDIPTETKIGLNLVLDTNVKSSITFNKTAAKLFGFILNYKYVFYDNTFTYKTLDGNTTNIIIPYGTYTIQNFVNNINNKIIEQLHYYYNPNDENQKFLPLNLTVVDGNKISLNIHSLIDVPNGYVEKSNWDARYIIVDLRYSDFATFYGLEKKVYSNIVS